MPARCVLYEEGEIINAIQIKLRNLGHIIEDRGIEIKAYFHHYWIGKLARADEIKLIEMTREICSWYEIKSKFAPEEALDLLKREVLIYAKRMCRRIENTELKKMIIEEGYKELERDFAEYQVGGKKNETN